MARGQGTDKAWLLLGMIRTGCSVWGWATMLLVCGISIVSAGILMLFW